MRNVRIVLLVLVVAECCIQAVLSYWWYEYKCGAYYNLVIKGDTLHYILRQVEDVLLVTITILLFYLLIRRVLRRCRTQ